MRGTKVLTQCSHCLRNDRIENSILVLRAPKPLSLILFSSRGALLSFCVILLPWYMERQQVSNVPPTQFLSARDAAASSFLQPLPPHSRANEAQTLIRSQPTAEGVLDGELWRRIFSMPDSPAPLFLGTKITHHFS